MGSAIRTLPYHEALAFLYGRINYERAADWPTRPQALRLDRMRELLERIGEPQRGLRIIHLAGTKGKGSTAAGVAGILRAAGRRVGVYSSPHLERLEERLNVDGMPCGSDQLAYLIERIRPSVLAMDRVRGGVGPTFFEITTAAALLHFSEEEVDFAVLEVGMGGRLDSTNVCAPAISVITSISFDHTQQLGNSLASIAREKAGIIKPGIPVVCGVTAPEARAVIRSTAVARGCQLAELGTDFAYRYRAATDWANGSLCTGWLDYEDLPTSTRFSELPLGLPGDHQAENAAIAIATVLRLQDGAVPLTESLVGRALSAVRLPARTEVISQDPLVILDAAHNAASMKALIETLRPLNVAGRSRLIFASTRDKDTRGMFRHAFDYFDEVLLTRFANNPRATPVDDLESLAQQVAAECTAPPRVTVAESSAAAWRRCRDAAGPQDLICAAGSFFLAAELRPEMGSEKLGYRG